MIHPREALGSITSDKMDRMISRIEGELVSVQSGRIELRVGDVVYELLIPAIDTQRLGAAVGRTIEFHTLHYLESQGQGTSFIPRLIGFASRDDRAFFEVFTTVKGLGNRKALRALELPFSDVANAIAAQDADLLKSLPEIGKRTAETIIVELSGKIDRFVEVKGGSSSALLRDGHLEIARDAVMVLVQLGETKLNAKHLVDRVLDADPEIATADQVVAAAFRLKELV
jgi:holliday junction DNA helicase RuvA